MDTSITDNPNISKGTTIPSGMTVNPVGITTKSGSITTAYVVTCAICQKFEIRSHPSYHSFEEFLVNDETSKWRLSRSSGWVHKSCLKFISPLK